jgi:methionyl-tRNA synthetase
MDSLEEIGEGMVLKTNDVRSAVQYVFYDERGEEFLEEHSAEGTPSHCAGVCGMA